MSSLVPFAQYFWEPKTALKNEVYFKKERERDRELKDNERTWLEHGISEFEMKDKDEDRQRWPEETWLTKLS